MFTQTIIPESASVTLRLPDDFVGEQVTVIAIVEKKDEKETTASSYEERLQEIKATFSRLPGISHTNYKFNRDEAKDYE